MSKEEDIVKGNKKERDPHSFLSSSLRKHLGPDVPHQPQRAMNKRNERRAYSYSMLAETQPPNFSKGSVELQHAVSDATEQSVPVADSPYVLFSAHKVLKQKKLANISSLGL
jgi:hypothetical protein